MLAGWQRNRTSKMIESSDVLLDRFRHLPAMQEEREQEYTQQAKYADALARRLEQTREEAEHIAIAEIERTRSIQRSELLNHPEWIALQAERDRMRMEASAWNQQQKADRDRIQRDLQSLKQAFEDKMMQAQQARQTFDLKAQQERNLQLELSELNAKHDHMLSLLEQLEQEQSQRQSFLQPLLKDYNDVMKEHAEIKAQQETLQNQLNRFEVGQPLANDRQSAFENLQILIRERHELEKRQTEAEYDCNKAKGLMNTAMATMEYERQVLGQLEAEAAEDKKKQDEADAELLKATQFINQIEEMSAQENVQLAQTNAQMQAINQRRSDIRRQIELLLEEQKKLDDQFTFEQLKTDDLTNNLLRLRRDKDTASRGYENAMHAKNYIAKTLTEKMNGIDAQRRKMNQLETKLREAEGEAVQADNLQKTIRSDRDRLDELIKRNSDQIGEIDKRLDFMKGEYTRLQNELLILDNNEKDKRKRMEEIAARISEIQREGDLPKESIAKIRADLRDLENHLNMLKIRQQPQQEPSAWQMMEAELADLKDRLANAHVSFESIINAVNPFTDKFNELQARMRNLDQQLSSTWKQNPPLVLREQLAREAEAIMRAEAAAALEKRQSQIKKEADALADIHLAKTPRFVIEPGAADILLKEHQIQQSGPRGNRAIADAVLSMCDQHQIHV